MKGISQVIVSILLVGVVIVAGSMLSYIVTETMASQKPSNIVVARVGDIDVELRFVTDRSYFFAVTTKLANFGSEPITILGYITMLIKGTTGEASIVNCALDTAVTINPGEIKEATGFCILDKQQTIRRLFGTLTPPADTIRASMRCLHLYIFVIQSSTGVFLPS